MVWQQFNLTSSVSTYRPGIGIMLSQMNSPLTASKSSGYPRVSHDGKITRLRTLPDIMAPKTRTVNLNWSFANISLVINVRCLSLSNTPVRRCPALPSQTATSIWSRTVEFFTGFCTVAFVTKFVSLAVEIVVVLFVVGFFLALVADSLGRKQGWHVIPHTSYIVLYISNILQCVSFLKHLYGPLSERDMLFVCYFVMLASYSN